MIERDTTKFGKFRDATAMRIANFALNHIATPWYRYMVGGLIMQGMATILKKKDSE